MSVVDPTSRKAHGDHALLEVSALRKHYPIRGGLMRRPTAALKAVDGVDFTLARGETLGVVGESGSGKSTIGNLVLRLQETTDGQILFDGTDITKLSRSGVRPFRRRMQMIFQDPYSSLNPRMTVRQTLAEALATHNLVARSEQDDRIADLLRQVGLPAEHMHRYPRAFSGGQRQRIAVARALAVEPEFVVADEPVSALDVSIQAEVITLLARLREEFRLTMMFISHDLSVVEILANRVLVLYLGRVMEIGRTADLFDRPHHPYTRALLSAVPGRRMTDSAPLTLTGDVPSPIDAPSGCVLRTRCPFALPECAAARPALRKLGEDHASACIRDDIQDNPIGRTSP